MNKPRATFGVVTCIAPYEGAKHRHSPIMDSLEDATAEFTKTVREARLDLSVMRIALHRYTVGKTDLLDEWHRGQFTCGLHRESDPSRLISTERAA